SRAITSRMQVLKLEMTSEAASDAALAHLKADPRVQFADYDRRRFAQAVPSDPYYAYVSMLRGQWYLQGAQPAYPAAINAEAAWDKTKGSKAVVIADLDTGVRYDHPDLARATAAGKILPGYDFISDPDQANDGDGPDANASDPGDWISNVDASGLFFGCQVEPSSWHGTRTAGIIGAMTGNALGVAAINWNSYVLPVRVLGKCGGFDSDIIAGARWAAGLHQDGIPDNPYPARIINMSLGGGGACNAAIVPQYFDLIADLEAVGTVIVASAGNEGDAVSLPANCPGVIAVAGLRHVGSKVGFSNLGPAVTIAAPGGNCVNTGAGQPCLFSIDTTTNTGTTSPVGPDYTDETNFNVGTSFSAPMVSAVASLMLGVNANLQSAHLIARLKQTARPFPGPETIACRLPDGIPQTSPCNCTTATCGAGMLDANGAVSAALRPIASVALPATVASGNNVNLDGGVSAAACDRTIFSYQWSVSSGPGSLTSLTLPATSIVAPPVGQQTVVHLVVTDSVGDTDSADITITGDSATSTVPTITPAACPAEFTVPQIAEPTSTISASPTSITAGQSSTLTWSSTNSTSCTAGGNWAGTKAVSGSEGTGALSTTKTYTIVCDGPGGTSTIQTAVVTVTGVSSGGGGGGGGGGGVLGLLSLLGLSGLLWTTRHTVR
ncbi:MAG: S8 family serine peptidase, partial [Steroidobacteraceae bacterium]